MKNKLEMWYYNTTKRDIVLAELDMSIKRHTQLNFLKHNPVLTPERIKLSERMGILGRHLAAGRIVRLDGPIKIKDDAPKYIESKEPIYSKTHSVITIDPNEKDFVDQLEEDFIGDQQIDAAKQVAINERFLKKVNLDGFADPLADLPDSE